MGESLWSHCFKDVGSDLPLLLYSFSQAIFCAHVSFNSVLTANLFYVRKQWRLLYYGSVVVASLARLVWKVLFHCGCHQHDRQAFSFTSLNRVINFRWFGLVCCFYNAEFHVLKVGGKNRLLPKIECELFRAKNAVKYRTKTPFLARKASE